MLVNLLVGEQILQKYFNFMELMEPFSSCAGFLKLFYTRKFTLYVRNKST